ncbi:hypothetical protein GCM10011514_14930 [Emticicia aquatilis]|uniref:Uncharacterized protein n=1 Tax=Emticicia aquatilis TaxID=1537369 RepID=A0A917DNI1_9BACT|nr:hypothetical protein [Emticicia aquatilis]GGD51715.1 hypothetical protein GCM10011514_14930 [Emticicia aquatilis]
MLKVGIITSLLALELGLYYTLGNFPSFIVQVAIIGYMFYWYYSERKADFNISDKLLIASTVVSLFSPLTVYLTNFFVSSTIKFTLIALNYILVIILFRLEGAKIDFSGKSKTFLVFVSYIFTPFAFLFAVIFPLTSLQNAILSGAYILPLTYMVLLSTFLPFPEKSKFYISISMFTVLLASGVSAYHLYVSSFPFDYPILRSLITTSRVCMLLGMLNRFDSSEKTFLT